MQCYYMNTEDPEENTVCQTLSFYGTARICKAEDVQHLNRQICCAFAGA